MSAEYKALVSKVDGFVEQTSARRRDDMRCEKGCDACCHAWLSVGPVEADAVRAGLGQLTSEARELVRARGEAQLLREQRAEAPRCAMLEDDGSCAIYEQRPLVCRTQGHALRYPTGFIPEHSVRARTSQGEVTWCPLNYEAARPAPDDVLDAERVDQLLSLVTLRHTGGDRERALTRFDLSALAAFKP